MSTCWRAKLYKDWGFYISDFQSVFYEQASKTRAGIIVRGSPTLSPSNQSCPILAFFLLD